MANNNPTIAFYLLNRKNLLLENIKND